MQMASKCPIEVELKIARKDCMLENLLSGIDCQIERLVVRKDRVLHRVTPGNGFDIEAKLRSRNFDCRRTRNGTLWVESRSCRGCSFFSSIPFLEILGITSQGTGWLKVKALLPSLSSLRSLRARLRQAALEFQIYSVKPFSHKEMTKRERETLEIALKMNYFEFENRSTLSGLAEQMGVSKSSLSETLRRGTKKAVVQYLSSHD